MRPGNPTRWRISAPCQAPGHLDPCPQGARVLGKTGGRPTDDSAGGDEHCEDRLRCEEERSKKHGVTGRAAGEVREGFLRG